MFLINFRHDGAGECGADTIEQAQAKAGQLLRAARNCGAIGSEVEIWITDEAGREFTVEPAPEPRAFSATETMQAAMEVLGVSLSQEQFFEAAAALERRLNF